MPLQRLTTSSYFDECLSSQVVETIMGRDPATMKINAIEGEIIFLCYIRSDDGSLWEYKCRLDGNRALWVMRADDGELIQGIQL